MDSTGIRELAVEGLHEQLDVHLEFNSGLNIIYGKNGRGKTTVLHILANALELDFKRFSYLSFRRIAITTFSGDVLEIVKSADNKCLVSLNGAATSFLSDGSALSEAEAASIRAVIGFRATYLPAFRSVLERIRNDYSGTYQPRDTAQQVEMEQLEAHEFLALRELWAAEARGARESLELRSLREEATTTIRKTYQCRQWFGPFIPTIRYPSILEVDDGLSSEWRGAQLETAQGEQKAFADVFVKVFRTIVGIDKPGLSEDTESLLASIQDSLSDTDKQLGNKESSGIFQNLSEAADHLKRTGSPDASGLENAVLRLYLQTLVDRNQERKQAFQKSKDFESSINKFLDKKTLRIGLHDSRPPQLRSRSVVAVGTQGGRSYGLSALSSGEKQILTMLYSASRSRFRTGVFLIDEPELSLHIDWQRRILHELMRLSPNRQIIACTHSPEVGADHIAETQDFEPTLTGVEQDSLFNDDETQE